MKNIIKKFLAFFKKKEVKPTRNKKVLEKK